MISGTGITNTRNSKTHSGLPFTPGDPYEMDVSLVPVLDDKYYIGTSTRRLSALYAYNLDAIDANLATLTVTTSAAIESLTVATDVHLPANTYIDGVLYTGATGLPADVSFNTVQVTGPNQALLVTNGITAGADVNIGGDLYLGMASRVRGRINATGNIVSDGDIAAAGDLVGSDLDLTGSILGDTAVTGALQVNGDVTAQDLDLSGAILGDTHITGALQVDGEIVVRNTDVAAPSVYPSSNYRLLMQANDLNLSLQSVVNTFIEAGEIKVSRTQIISGLTLTSTLSPVESSFNNLQAVGIDVTGNFTAKKLSLGHTNYLDIGGGTYVPDPFTVPEFDLSTMVRCNFSRTFGSNIWRFCKFNAFGVPTVDLDSFPPQVEFAVTDTIVINTDLGTLAATGKVSGPAIEAT